MGVRHLSENIIIQNKQCIPNSLGMIKETGIFKDKEHLLDVLILLQRQNTSYSIK